MILVLTHFADEFLGKAAPLAYNRQVVADSLSLDRDRDYISDIPTQPRAQIRPFLRFPMVHAMLHKAQGPAQVYAAYQRLHHGWRSPPP